MNSTVVRHLENLQSDPPDKSSTHLTPYVAVTVLLTLFPMPYHLLPRGCFETANLYFLIPLIGFFLEAFFSLPLAVSFGQLIKRVKLYLCLSWKACLHSDVCLPGGKREIFHGKLNHLLACLTNCTRAVLLAVK